MKRIDKKRQKKLELLRKRGKKSLELLKKKERRKKREKEDLKADLQKLKKLNQFR